MLKTVYTLLAFAIAGAASAESLKVDFNGNSWGAVIADTQSGFEPYNARNEVEADFIAADYVAFGTTVTVTPSWSDDAVAAAKQSFWRDNSGGYVEDDENLFFLLRDWIGTDTRQLGDPLTLTISGLPAGTYYWTSWHHDTAAANMGAFDVAVNDAAGSMTTSGIAVTGNAVTTIAGVSCFETTLQSNGTDDVTLTFDLHPYSYEFNQAWFVLNGFELASESSFAVRRNAPLRRVASPQQPMWLVHIDTWNYADPRKIIELIPEDIRPFVVMNISLSISHDEETSRFQVAEYGYDIAKSWLSACAEYGMWAMVQPSSGGYSQFPDNDLSVFEEFFRDYPNMLGFNYCEQFWGYDSQTDPLSAAWTDRINHFANLLELSDRYGGYLVVSWCGNQWSPSINPIAMLKRSPKFASACRQYTDNYILCEKYTQQSYISDMESICLGAYLSGYSGQYGIRYDDTGWTDAAGEHANFTMATAGAAHLEHIMLTGMTVIDAPELIWTQCFRELSSGYTTDGFSMRRWGTFAQFDNVSVDLFRKVLDGTVRIPSREEVIERTKIAIVNDVNSGSNDDIYSTPETLFEGLYRMDGDGNHEYNMTFFKKTGRYPTVPTVFALNDELANSFEIQVNRSNYSARWHDISAKVAEFDSLFPDEYTGDLYAGRHENGWVVYNPYKTGQTASGSIPFKYNSCERMELTFSQYSSGVVKEYGEHISVYLENFDNVLDTGLKTDIISIYGCASAPSWSSADRASHQASRITESYANGLFTLTIRHNGPLDIEINCSGTATDRLTQYTDSVITEPAAPPAFAGPVQYEAECFDYKNVAGIVKGGYYDSVRNYTGQGYLRLGTSSSAAVRDYVSVLDGGSYRLETRYSVVEADVATVDLYVNGVLVAAPLFEQTATLSDWAVSSQNIPLNAGTNSIELRARAYAAGSLYIDNILVVPTFYGSGLVLQENAAGFAGVDGTVESSYSGFSGEGYADTEDAANAAVRWTVNCDDSVTKAFTFRYACPDDRTAALFVNGRIAVTGIEMSATGGFSAWDYVTVYTAAGSGVNEIALRADSLLGLPNIDSLEITGAVLPQAPSGLAAVSDDTLISLSWETSIESGVAGYNIYRSMTTAAGFEKLNSSLLTEPAYVDSAVTNYITYYYAVTSVDQAGFESEFSAEASGMPDDGSICVIASVDFESGFGGWANITAGDTNDWLRNTGSTLTPSTGPAGGAGGSDWYAYLETSPGGASNAGSTAILESPQIYGRGRVMTFFYHMYGIDTG
ncbi:MAG: glycoside hydrolase family 98 domain-containing protein, partial [Phycisphaerae bacterium]